MKYTLHIVSKKSIYMLTFDSKLHARQQAKLHVDLGSRVFVKPTRGIGFWL